MTHFYNDPTDLIKLVEENFYKDVQNHEMTVLMDVQDPDPNSPGLFRHLRFANPTSSQYHFTITTTPGYLTIQGDYGAAFTFRRIHDMMEFFKPAQQDFTGNRLRIDPHYWSEKLTSHERHSREVSAYSQDIFTHTATYCAAEEVKYRPELKGLVEDLTERLRWEDTDTEAAARDFLNTYVYSRTYKDTQDGGNRIATFNFRDHDTWEWNLRDWTYQYVWACFALAWACGKYDAQRPTAHLPSRSDLPETVQKLAALLPKATTTGSRKASRKRCGTCGDYYAVKKDGTVRAHSVRLNYGSGLPPQGCAGSGKPPRPPDGRYKDKTASTADSADSADSAGTSSNGPLRATAIPLTPELAEQISADVTSLIAEIQAKKIIKKEDNQ